MTGDSYYKNHKKSDFFPACFPNPKPIFNMFFNMFFNPNKIAPAPAVPTIYKHVAQDKDAQ